MAYTPYVNSPGVKKPAPNAQPSYINSPGLNPTSAAAFSAAASKYLQPKPNQPNTPPVTPPGGTPPNQDAGSSPQGTSLPYAGVYLEQQNNAEKAYEDAQTQLLSTRNALYHRYGLLGNGQVDPNSQYGDYQTMLSREGNDLDAARENSVGRGLGSGGLARQGESALRYADGSEQLDFQNQVLGADSDYRTGLLSALSQKNSAFSSAEEQANQDALQKMLADGYFTPAGPSGGDNNTTPPPPTNDNKVVTPPPSKAAADALARYLANNNVAKKTYPKARAS